MITSTEANQSICEADLIRDLIESSGISSIQSIASAVEMDEDAVVRNIENLIQAGSLNGYLTDDKTRFFKSDVRLSDAPSIRSHSEGLIFEHPDTRSNRYAMLGGVLSIIGGLVVRAVIPLNEMIQSIGSSFVLIGMVILASGWLLLSRKASSIRQV